MEFYCFIIFHWVKFCVLRKTMNVSGLRFDSLSRKASIMSKGSFIFMWYIVIDWFGLFLSRLGCRKKTLKYMLSGITKSEAVARGKSTCEMSQLMRKENYTIGIKEWERPIGSVYHYQFLNRKPDPNVFKAQHPSTS